MSKTFQLSPEKFSEFQLSQKKWGEGIRNNNKHKNLLFHMPFYLFLNQNLELSGNLMPWAYNTSPVHTGFFWVLFCFACSRFCVCFHIKNYQSEKMTRQELIRKSRVFQQAQGLINTVPGWLAISL